MEGIKSLQKAKSFLSGRDVPTLHQEACKVNWPLGPVEFGPYWVRLAPGQQALPPGQDMRLLRDGKAVAQLGPTLDCFRQAEVVGACGDDLAKLLS